ncbi:MAG TPA: hypothetical protein VKT27_10305 [Candidatus Binataceae bacterium]|nr:hypothetical protein [Candidatus Binataceae bacterium]
MNEGSHRIECPRCRLMQWIDLSHMVCDNCGLDLLRPRAMDFPYRRVNTLEMVAIVAAVVIVPLGAALLYVYH